jgi:hypothetical protein
MDWLGCGSKLWVGGFLFLWLWLMGLLYAGKFDNRASPAIAGLAYSGVISAYTALGIVLEHSTSSNCHKSSFNVAKIRESFLAMLVLLFFEAFVLTVRGQSLLNDDVDRYFGLLEEASTNVFGLYLDATRFSPVRITMRDETTRHLEELFAQMDVLRGEANQHLLQAREEPAWGAEPFPAQQWTAFVDGLFGVQNHVTAIYGAMKAAEADRMKYKELYGRLSAGDGGPSYERLGSDRESDRNPLLIADDSMYQTLERLHATLKATLAALRRQMRQATYTAADLAVDKPIYFEELVESLAAQFQELLSAAHASSRVALSESGNGISGGSPAYPNQKVCANYMVHRSLRNITTEFYRMEVALCGLATVAASIYINPGSADPSLAEERTYGNPRSPGF